MAQDADEEFTDLEGRPIPPAPPPSPEEIVRIGDARRENGTGHGWFGAVRSGRSRIPRRHRGTEGYIVDLETSGE